MGSCCACGLLPTLRPRPAAAGLLDAELATLHAIVEEQQAKWVVPKAKAKAAPTLAELDEWENRPTAEKRLLMQKARRVMEGNRASASASASASVADAIVYVPATGAKFHSRPRCGSMKTAQAVTLACAEARGYTRCGSCW